MASGGYYLDQEGRRLDRILNHIIEQSKSSTVMFNLTKHGRIDDFHVHGRQVHVKFHPLRMIKYSLIKKVIAHTSKLSHVVEIESLLNKHFGVNVKLLDYVLKSVAAFKVDQKIAYRYFKIHKPKRLYLDCSYGMEATIYAAHSNNIIVVELQHGWIGKSHPGYHFPENQIVPYFPDQIVLMGEYWNEQVNLPINSRITVEPIPYYKDGIEKVRKFRRNNFTYEAAFLFGYHIPVEFILKISKNRPKMNFILKPHVNSNPFVLEQIKELDNVFLSSEDKDYYDIFISSKYVVTISSTILYETVSCGVPVVVLKDKSNYKDMGFIANHQIKLIDYSSDLDEIEFPEHYIGSFVNGIFN